MFDRHDAGAPETTRRQINEICSYTYTCKINKIIQLFFLNRESRRYENNKGHIFCRFFAAH